MPRASSESTSKSARCTPINISLRRSDRLKHASESMADTPATADGTSSMAPSKMRKSAASKAKGRKRLIRMEIDPPSSDTVLGIDMDVDHSPSMSTPMPANRMMTDLHHPRSPAPMLADGFSSDIAMVSSEQCDNVSSGSIVPASTELDELDELLSLTSLPDLTDMANSADINNTNRMLLRHVPVPVPAMVSSFWQPPQGPATEPMNMVEDGASTVPMASTRTSTPSTPTFHASIHNPFYITQASAADLPRVNPDVSMMSIGSMDSLDSAASTDTVATVVGQEIEEREEPASQEIDVETTPKAKKLPRSKPKREQVVVLASEHNGLELPPWHQHDSLAHQDDENDDAVDTWQYIGRSSSPTPTPAHRARSLTPHLSLAPWMRVEDDSDQQHQHDLHPTRTSVRHSRPAPYTVRPSVARSRFQHGPPADQASGSSDLAPAFYSTPQHQHWSSPPSIPSRIRRKSRQSHQFQVVHRSATPASTPGPTSSPASTPPSHNEHWKTVLGLAPLAPSFVHPPALASSLALAAQAQAYTHSHSHSLGVSISTSTSTSRAFASASSPSNISSISSIFSPTYSPASGRPFTSGSGSWSALTDTNTTPTTSPARDHGHDHEASANATEYDYDCYLPSKQPTHVGPFRPGVQAVRLVNERLAASHVLYVPAASSSSVSSAARSSPLPSKPRQRKAASKAAAKTDTAATASTKATRARKAPVSGDAKTKNKVAVAQKKAVIRDRAQSAKTQLSTTDEARTKASTEVEGNAKAAIADTSTTSATIAAADFVVQCASHSPSTPEPKLGHPAFSLKIVIPGSNSPRRSHAALGLDLLASVAADRGSLVLPSTPLLQTPAWLAESDVGSLSPRKRWTRGKARI